MDSWKFDSAPQPYGVERPDSKYVLLMVMGADGNLGKHIGEDINEISDAINDDISAVILLDLPSKERSYVAEITRGGVKNLEVLPDINLGDPRWTADFLSRALVSFSESSMVAIGFAGHGQGAFKDYDEFELALSREFRFAPLGHDSPGDEVLMEPRLAEKVVTRSMLADKVTGNALTNRETSSALATAFYRAKRKRKVDLVFFDTCLNGSVEVFCEVRHFAEQMVASSFLTPETGWNYRLWLALTRTQQPKCSEAWSNLAVGAFGAENRKIFGRMPAQLAASSTSEDFVAEFAELVRALKDRGEDGYRLLMEAAQRTESIYYEENLDLGDLVTQLSEVTQDEEIRQLGNRYLTSQCKAVRISESPPGKERLRGLTIWCPIRDDRENVRPYYRGLEFDRRTGWMDFLATGEKLAKESSGSVIEA